MPGCLRVIGIDPGSKACGYGIIEEKRGKLFFVDSGVVSPKASLPIAERIHIIRKEISMRIEQFSPTCMSIEKVFVAKNSKSALHLGQARGAVLAAAGEKKVETHEYSATSVKKSLTGNGRASKENIQKILSIMFGERTFESADDADAIAVAVCHLNRSRNSPKIPYLTTAAKKSGRRRFTLNDINSKRQSS